MHSIERDASGRQDLEARIGIEYGLGKVHLHSAQRIDHIGEGVEVEDHVVLDRDAEVLVDGRHQLAGTLEECGIDFVGSRSACIGNEQVAGDGKDGQGPLRRIQVKHHHHVAVDPGDSLGAQPVGRVLDLEGTAVGGADQEDVFSSGVRAARWDVYQALHIETADLVVQIPAVSGCPPHQEDQDDTDGAQDPPQPPMASRARSGGLVTVTS